MILKARVTALVAICWLLAFPGRAQVSISLPKLTDVSVQAGLVPGPNAFIGGDHTPPAVMWNLGIETLFQAGMLGKEVSCADAAAHDALSDKQQACPRGYEGAYCRLTAAANGCKNACWARYPDRANASEEQLCENSCVADQVFKSCTDKLDTARKAGTGRKPGDASDFAYCLNEADEVKVAIAQQCATTKCSPTDADGGSCRRECECQAGSRDPTSCIAARVIAATSQPICREYRIEVGVGYFETTMAGRNPLLRTSSFGQVYEFTGNIRSLPAVAVYIGHDLPGDWSFFGGVSATLAKITGVSNPAVASPVDPSNPGTSPTSVGYSFTGDTLAFGPRIGFSRSFGNRVAAFSQLSFDRYQFTNLQYTLFGGTKVLPNEFPRQLSWNFFTVSLGLQFEVQPP
jgi:hypothetical protein